MQNFIDPKIIYEYRKQFELHAATRCQKFNIFHTNATCNRYLEKKQSTCGSILKMTHRKNNKSEYPLITWRCYRCSTYQSILNSSFFGLFHKPLFVLMKIIQNWAAESSVEKCLTNLKFDNIEICRQTISKMYTRLRNICSESIDRQNIKLGGDGVIVEIDESLYARNIYSDKWAAYNDIKALYHLKLKHETVNHSLYFVNPDSFVCTNKIESYWNASKYKFKSMCGCMRMLIQGYLDEFMWRKNNKLERFTAFDAILAEIGKAYNIYEISEEFIKEIELRESRDLQDEELLGG